MVHFIYQSAAFSCWHSAVSCSFRTFFSANPPSVFHNPSTAPFTYPQSNAEFSSAVVRLLAASSDISEPPSILENSVFVGSSTMVTVWILAVSSAEIPIGSAFANPSGASSSSIIYVPAATRSRISALPSFTTDVNGSLGYCSDVGQVFSIT